MHMALHVILAGPTSIKNLLSSFPLLLFFTEDSLGVAILGSPAANPFRFMRLTVHPHPNP